MRVLTARGPLLVPAVAALLGLGCVAAGVSRAGFDARHPKTNSVFYLLDADAGRASWVSTDAALDGWTSQFFGGEPRRRGNLASVFPWANQPTWQAEAPASEFPAPAVELLEDRTEEDVRTLRLRLRSERLAPLLVFYTEPGASLRGASLEWKSLGVGGPDGGGTEGPPLRVSFAAPPPEGVELILQVNSGRPLRLTVEDVSYGLPDVPGFAPRPRDPDMMPVPSYRTSDTTVVKTTLGFDPD